MIKDIIVGVAVCLIVSALDKLREYIVKKWFNTEK